ncbi:hypothetical protein DFH09DRAFT_1301594 [Mycena vulgaris]|nr:hypothetical protein DFH09DRAFT_1301594 [Mycena vulgaris]
MDSEADTVQNLLCEQFQLRFLCWIQGVGLPRSIRDKFISADDYKSHRRDPLVRAKMFVSSMTDMTLIPPDPQYQFTIHLERAFGSDIQKAVALHFHDCTETVDVPMNAWLDNILLEPVAFEELTVVTEFDHWMSAECSLKAGDYNDL